MSYEDCPEHLLFHSRGRDLFYSSVSQPFLSYGTLFVSGKHDGRPGGSAIKCCERGGGVYIGV